MKITKKQIEDFTNVDRVEIYNDAIVGLITYSVDVGPSAEQVVVALSFREIADHFGTTVDNLEIIE